MSPFVRLSAPSRLSIFTPSSVDLDRSYFPSRGLPYSILVHGTAFAALLFLSVLSGPADPDRVDPRINVEQSHTKVIMWLPRISDLSPAFGSKAEPAPGAAQLPPASGRRGSSYPGPQRILSEFPEPTSDVQTLIQPALRKLPVLDRPLALPNLVLLADASPALQSTPAEPVAPIEEAKPKAPEPVKAPPKAEPAPPQAPQTAKAEEPPPVQIEEPKPVEPSPLPPPPAAIDSTTLVVPPSEAPPPLPRTESPLLVSPPPAPKLDDDQKTAPQPPVKAAVEQPKSVEEPKPSEPQKPVEGTKQAKQAESGEGPKAAVASSGAAPQQPAPALELAPVPTRGPDVRTVVSLNATPALNGQPVQIPAAESRGRFAISPEAKSPISKAEPGPSVNGSSAQVVIGAPSGGSTSSEAAANPPAAVTVRFGGGGGKGISAGGDGTAPPGSKPGSAVRISAGAGPKANGAFAGVRVIGGLGATGIARSSPAVKAQVAARPLQTSYGVFVLSTESSGGGLPTFGVFSNEQVYTAYLDMRQSASESAPSWTVEFALARETPPPVDSSGDLGPNRGLVLPFPVVKKLPALPVELVRRHLSKLIIVYAVINAEGKMEQLSVKDTPDPLLATPVVEALSEWVFKPAVVGGVSVPVKVLLGIPLWASD